VESAIIASQTAGLETLHGVDAPCRLSLAFDSSSSYFLCAPPPRPHLAEQPGFLMLLLTNVLLATERELEALYNGPVDHQRGARAVPDGVEKTGLPQDPIGASISPKALDRPIHKLKREPSWGGGTGSTSCLRGRSTVPGQQGRKWARAGGSSCARCD
jgi:hypothetical protein